jgi:hypothetical protein
MDCRSLFIRFGDGTVGAVRSTRRSCGGWDEKTSPERGSEIEKNTFKASI